MTIGVLGAGQLGRMLALAGYRLGLHFRFFDRSPDACGAETAPMVTGSFDDAEALKRFAEGLSAATSEFENVPARAMELVAESVPVYPPPRAFEVAQDRLPEKELFRKAGIETPAFFAVDSSADLEKALLSTGCPAVLKTRRLGYDGKGQCVIKSPQEARRCFDMLGGVPLILEQFVAFERECSIIAVRSIRGETKFYPLVHNVHREGILRCSRVPFAKPEQQRLAESYIARLLDELNYTGVLALELFEKEGRLYANEMAPRVHNSGHWTIDGAETSQFENHLRAITGMPLGETSVRGYSAMVNIVGSLPDMEQLASVPGACIHLYGKAPRPGRKIGHVTVCEAAKEDAEAKLKQLLTLIP